MEKYILDTNIFFNMEEGLNLGDKTEQVIVQITNAAKQLKKNKQGEIIISPRIKEEILSFFENKDQQFLHNFFAASVIQSPGVGSQSVPADVLYKLVEDMRLRNYRGLRIGEEEIQKAGEYMAGKPVLVKKDFQMTIGKVILTFRNRYRQATRVGFIDSLADLDMIMLARELDGYMVTTDEGVLHWGRIFGVKEMPASAFGVKMREVLQY